MYDFVLSTRKKINLENEYESNLVVRSYSNAALQESRPKAGFRGGQLGLVENHAQFFRGQSLVNYLKLTNIWNFTYFVTISKKR